MAHSLGYLVAKVFERRDPLGTRRLRRVGRARAPVLHFLFALAAFFSPAAAQPAPQPLRFTVFSARPIAGLAFVPRAGAPQQKLVFYPTARSPRYEFRGAMPVRFVDEATNAVVAEATIPPGMREAFLLFAPIAAATPGGLRYQISVLDDGAARHGPGGLVIVNLSGLELSGTVGNVPVALKAGLNPTLALGPATKIALRTGSKNRSYQSYAGTIDLKRNQRALLLLFPPFYQGSLEVQSRLLLDEVAGASAGR
ncbi:MAG: hypothetical protein ABIZ49_02225 [Opitutaceae bacterium]